MIIMYTNYTCKTQLDKCRNLYANVFTYGKLTLGNYFDKSCAIAIPIQTKNCTYYITRVTFVQH